MSADESAVPIERRRGDLTLLLNVSMVCATFAVRRLSFIMLSLSSLFDLFKKEKTKPRTKIEIMTPAAERRILGFWIFSKSGF